MSDDDWGSKFMLGAVNGINEMFARMWTIVILLGVYMLLCVGMAELTGTEPMTWFWGIPVAIFFFVVISVISSTAGGSPATSNVQGSADSYLQASEDRQKKHLEALERAIGTLLSGSQPGGALLAHMQAVKPSDPRELHKSPHFLWCESVFLALESKSAARLLLAVTHALRRGWVYLSDERREREQELLARVTDANIARLLGDAEFRALMIGEMCASLACSPPVKFNDALVLVRISAIPPGSFLEEEVGGTTENVAFLRRAASAFRQEANSESFDALVLKSSTVAKVEARKKIDKAMARKTLNANDMNNVLRWVRALCFQPVEDDLSCAEVTVQRVLARSESGKQTKPVLEAREACRSFLAKPKGVGDTLEARHSRTLGRLDRLRATAASAHAFEDPGFYREILRVSDELRVAGPGTDEAGVALLAIAREARLNISSVKATVEEMGKLSSELTRVVRDLSTAKQKGVA